MGSINEILALIPSNEFKNICKIHGLKSWYEQDIENSDHKEMRDLLERTRPPPFDFSEDNLLKQEIFETENCKQKQSHAPKTLESNHSNVVYNENICDNSSYLQRVQIKKEPEPIFTVPAPPLKHTKIQQTGCKTKQNPLQKMKSKQTVQIYKANQDCFKNTRKSPSRRISIDQAADKLICTNRFDALSVSTDNEESEQESDEMFGVIEEEDDKSLTKKNKNFANTIPSSKKNKLHLEKQKKVQISGAKKSALHDLSSNSEDLPLAVVEAKQSENTNVKSNTSTIRKRKSNKKRGKKKKKVPKEDDFTNVNNRDVQLPPFLIRRRLRIVHPERGMQRYMPEAIQVEEELLISKEFEQAVWENFLQRYYLSKQSNADQ